MLRTLIRRAAVPIATVATRGAARIVAYHRFGRNGEFRRLPVEIFEQHLAFLKENYHVTTLSDIVSRLRAREPFVPNSVVLTVDDGYRDFLTVAYPLLRKYQMPATLYVVPQFVDGQYMTWFDSLHEAAQSAAPGRYTFLMGSAVRTYELGSPESRNIAWEALADHCLALPTEDRVEFVDDARRVLNVPQVLNVPEQYASLSWDDVRGLDPALVDIGSHTMTHPILSRCRPELQRFEIVESKRMLEQKMGRRVEAFCYPNGMPRDFDKHCVELVAGAGYSSAVVMYGTLVEQGEDPFLMQRIGAADSLEMFQRQMDGVSHIANRFRGKGAYGS